MFAFARFLWTVCIALLASASAYAADLEVESDCTLASAIAAANSDSVIGGCPAGDGADSITLSADITLDAPLPRVTSEIAIEGGGHTISGNEAHRIFLVEESGRLLIKELTLVAGRTQGRGGAVYNRGSLTIVDSIFRENAAGRFGGAIANWGTAEVVDSSFGANSARYGGALYNRASANLNINGGSFHENQAALDADAGSRNIAVYGGAVYNQGAVEISDSAFNGNSSGRDAGAIMNLGQATLEESSFTANSAATDGGAIVNLNRLVIEDSGFSANLARGNFGGAIANWGQADITEGDFTSNELSSGAGAAIANWGSLTLQDSEFTGNATDTQAGAIYSIGEIVIRESEFQDNTSGRGGALVNRAGGRAEIIDSEFSGNVSEDLGGAIFSVDGASLVINKGDFRDNSAEKGAGAIFSSGDALVTDSKFRDNKAEEYGGAFVNGGEAEIRDSSFRDNAADAGEGGGIRNFGTRIALEGDNKFANNVGGDCIGCSEEEPSAPAGARAYSPSLSAPALRRASDEIVVEGACTLGNAIRAANVDSAIGGCAAGDGADVIGLTGDITLSAALPKIESQITIEGGGHTISGNERFRIFLVAANGNLTVKEMTLTKGKARDGATICVPGEADTDNDGGAICNHGKLNVVDSEFLDNSADLGGAIFNEGSRAEATVAASVFTNNSARFGGAIYGTDGTITITASEFTSNRAGEKGGAIRRYNGTVTQTGNIFINNRPDNCAGMSC